jgi:thiol-disulfide isomerase/thioredoxin
MFRFGKVASRSIVGAAIGFVAAACAAGPPAELVLDGSLIVSAVRAAIDVGNFPAAEQFLADHEAQYGVSPQMLLAQSWLGRGALGRVRLTDAERHARRTYAQGAELLRSRGMDDEPDLPIAMGAAIEVLAQVGVRRGTRSEAVMYLEGELRKFSDTSIPKRIQKNIHLINLEGQPTLDLSTTEWLGNQRLDAQSSEGLVQVLFFWAHWCADCKAQGPVLEQLLERYREDGLRIVAPTQRFGYVAGGEPAPPDVELAYIEAVRNASYPWLANVPVPLDEANHLSFGVSTTPTLVVVDRQGLIHAYHPGRMTEAELDAILRPLLFDTTEDARNRP